MSSNLNWLIENSTLSSESGRVSGSPTSHELDIYTSYLLHTKKRIFLSSILTSACFTVTVWSTSKQIRRFQDFTGTVELHQSFKSRDALDEWGTATRWLWGDGINPGCCCRRFTTWSTRRHCCTFWVSLLLLKMYLDKNSQSQLWGETETENLPDCNICNLTYRDYNRRLRDKIQT